MNLHERSDPVLRLLEDLRPIRPSDDRDRRVVSRCHAVLARRRHRDEALALARARGARMLDLAIATAIAVYGAIAAITAVQIVLVR